MEELKRTTPSPTATSARTIQITNELDSWRKYQTSGPAMRRTTPTIMPDVLPSVNTNSSEDWLVIFMASVSLAHRYYHERPQPAPRYSIALFHALCHPRLDHQIEPRGFRKSQEVPVAGKQWKLMIDAALGEQRV